MKISLETLEDDIEDEIIANTTESVEISSQDNEDDIVTEDAITTVNETDESVTATIETSNNNEVAEVTDVIESAELVETEEVCAEPADNAENNKSLEQAKYLLQVIVETEKLLTEAIDAENYEDAAVYQEKVEEITQLFQTQLLDLKLSEDEVRKML